MKKWLIGVAIVIGIGLMTLLVVVIPEQALHRVTPLPSNIDIAYKQAQQMGLLSPRYVVIDTIGYEYVVSESDFKAMPYPQKIADGLYRLPNGELVGVLK